MNNNDIDIDIDIDSSISGLVNLADISWDKAGEEAITEYKEGAKISTVMLQVDPERERISLSIKHAETNSPHFNELDPLSSEQLEGLRVVEVIVNKAEKNKITELARKQVSELQIITEVLKGELTLSSKVSLANFELGIRRLELKELSLKLNESISDLKSFFTLIYFSNTNSFYSFGKGHSLKQGHLICTPKCFDFIDVRSTNIELGDADQSVLSYESTYYIFGGII
jgi:hypothetical protein